jgi:hypothetical protein
LADRFFVGFLVVIFGSRRKSLSPVRGGLVLLLGVGCVWRWRAGEVKLPLAGLTPRERGDEVGCAVIKGEYFIAPGIAALLLP